MAFAGAKGMGPAHANGVESILTGIGLQMSGFSLRKALFGLGIVKCLRRLLVQLFLVLGFFALAQAQETPPSAFSSGRCLAPTGPHRLHPECLGQHLDFNEATLTRDWGEVRSGLNRLGITPIASYSAQFMGNPSGGQSRGFTYAGTLQVAILWDLEKLLRIPGLGFNVGGAWSTGKDLSADYVGNIFAINSAYTAPGNSHNNFTLGEIYLQQHIFDNSLVLAAGRLAPQSTFANLAVLTQYLNVGFNPVPGQLAINDPAFAAYPPGTEWGAQALYYITPELEFAIGVFNTNPRAAAGRKGGADFALQQGNRGALSVAQITYLFNHAPNNGRLPGQYILGGFYDSNKFTSLRNPSAKASGTYSVYGQFQQMVYRDGGADSQKGLTVWGEAAIAPKSTVNALPYFLGAGLSYQGPLAGRDNDIVSTGVIAGTFSRYISRLSAETVIEVNYQITLYSWLSITPDLQYIIRPGGSGSGKNALALGAQLSIVF